MHQDLNNIKGIMKSTYTKSKPWGIIGIDEIQNLARRRKRGEQNMKSILSAAKIKISSSSFELDCSN
jgi:hypothetical protein